jgi:hypothetical protein
LTVEEDRLTNATRPAQISATITQFLLIRITLLLQIIARNTLGLIK